jgi:hypothetical protein
MLTDFDGVRGVEGLLGGSLSLAESAVADASAGEAGTLRPFGGLISFGRADGGRAGDARADEVRAGEAGRTDAGGVRVDA